MKVDLRTILVDARNADEYIPKLIAEMQKADFVGFDTETEDQHAHDGIKEFRKGVRNAFDWTKMVVTGMSFYFPDGMNYFNGPQTAYYLNLNHADVENRIPFEKIKPLFEAKRPETVFLCHNASFELSVMSIDLNYQLEQVVCTLQMAVSAYGPDEYDHDEYIKAQFGDIKNLFAEAERVFHTGLDPEKPYSRGLNWEQQELMSKVLGKSSDATFSYNGFIKSIRYGYGLKEVIMSFFDHKMTTYEEVLGDKDHMGQLTGEEVCAYGAEDAFWVVPLFYRLLEFMTKNCPESIDAFFTQENPMVPVFSKTREQGININLQAVEDRREVERKLFAQGLRELKAAAKLLLPFPEEPNAKLVEYDKWYGQPDKKGTMGYDKYRERLKDWIELEDSADDFEQACQVSSSVSNAWAGGKTADINIGHYYQSRLFMYDLCDTRPITYKGKVCSDAETRGTLKERFENQLKEANDPDSIARLKLKIGLIDKLGEITNIETRMKLYLNPYMLLTDPVTKRMYPETTSMLATRRMAGSNPNTMQLAKRGESTYVRGFYLPEKDHVFVAPDWSQIELVLVGEFSGDPEFKVAFGQTPYQDLHLGAAADVLSVMIEGVTAELLKNMHKPEWKNDIPPALLVKPNGEKMDPADAKKYWRTEVGKGSNFNYWYSGALSTVGEKLGWTSDQMWEATDAYRQRFSVAEAWRVGLIEQAKWDGYVLLPDGHRRTRWEITHEWVTITTRLFEQYGLPGVKRFGEELIRKTRTRAGNQLVNALIQGTCATLAKRSILRINERIKADGYDAFFKMPIHDELVFSVNKNEVIEFITMIRGVMADHPDIIGNLKIDCSVALGRTFEPHNKKNNKFPMCMVELDEAPAIFGFEDGSKLNDDEVRLLVNEMFKAA